MTAVAMRYVTAISKEPFLRRTRHGSDRRSRTGAAGCSKDLLITFHIWLCANKAMCHGIRRMKTFWSWTPHRCFHGQKVDCRDTNVSYAASTEMRQAGGLSANYARYSERGYMTIRYCTMAGKIWTIIWWIIGVGRIKVFLHENNLCFCTSICKKNLNDHDYYFECTNLFAHRISISVSYDLRS